MRQKLKHALCAGEGGHLGPVRVSQRANLLLCLKPYQHNLPNGYCWLQRHRTQLPKAPHRLLEHQVLREGGNVDGEELRGLLDERDAAFKVADEDVLTHQSHERRVRTAINLLHCRLHIVG